MLSNLKLETKKIGLTHSVVLQTNQEWSFVRTKTERLSTFVQYKEHIFHTGRKWSVGRRIESEKHDASLFLLTSKSARFVITTADD